MNSISSKNFINSSTFKGLNFRFSIEIGSSTSSLRVTSFFEINKSSLLAIIDSLLLSCFILWTLFTKFSTSPKSFTNCAAVFGPIPGTPGILSDESPDNACTSITFSGPTPNFSITFSLVISFFFKGSIIETLVSKSCIKSLSEEIIVIFFFLDFPFFA